MLQTLITSKTRVKLILKFFLNSKNSSYLRGLESEFNEGSNAIRMELNRFEEAGLLESTISGNKKYFKANSKHPLFNDLNSLVRKYLGIDQIIEKVIEKTGNLQEVYLTGRAAEGLDSEIIELIMVGDSVDNAYISQLAGKVETLINRKISFAVFDLKDFNKYKITTSSKLFLVWNKQ